MTLHEELIAWSLMPEAEMRARHNAAKEIKALCRRAAEALAPSIPPHDEELIASTVEERSLADAQRHGQARPSALPRVTKKETET